MWVSRQWFSPEVLQRIRDAVAADPEISRRALSRLVCTWLEWRAPNGKLRVLGCRKALLQLERRGLVDLPACQKVAGFAPDAAKKLKPPKTVKLSCQIDELGTVEVVPVSSSSAVASKVWKGLMDAFHYLGAGPLCGAQIRYLIRSSLHGWLGALSFSAAVRSLKDRDEWIGWTEKARLANLQLVVCNSRFLIVPEVEVPNLASQVLALAARRLGGDWRERYGYEPVLVETFVDGQRFAGTCYQAANWQRIGQTAGRDDGFANGKVSTGKKEIYVYPLREDWQTVLRAEPKDRLVLRSSVGESDDWVEEEFLGARVNDERLRKRLCALTRDFFAQPGVLIPQVCSGSSAKTQAAYRFFDNKRIDLRTVLRGHVEATAKRMSEQKTVLAVQDTTTLNYTAHPSTEGLGPINTTKDNGVGLIVHDTMAFSLEGTPLGLVDVQCWARDPEEAGKSKKRKERPIEEKESVKWLRSYRAAAEVQELCPQTLVVSVGDREADIHELFLEAAQTKSGPKLLVRAERSRQRTVETDQAEEYEYLWEKMVGEPVAGHQDVHIPRKGGRAARTAKLEVRYASVTLRPPKGKDLAPVQVWAVYAREVDPPPEVKEPLEWMLLTTVAVSSFEQATERLRWYTLRWGIEVYHRVIKSGCRIEDRRLGTADRIESCLSIDLIVAWRIFWLTKQGRETPNMPCDVFLEEEEWKALCATVLQRPPPSTPPSLRDAIRMIASLGGFLGRKSDGEPGTTCLWRGLGRLGDIMVGVRTARLLQRELTEP